MLTISRAPLETALDQPRLYALGLDAVRTLANTLWTDHNVHDPGVTTVEIASYVATDLAMRASLPIEDLLAVETGNPERMRERFSSARTLLTNRPVTIRDYRKLLIDLPGVRNAWLVPAPLTYYAVSDNNQRRLFVQDPGVAGAVAIAVRGLYRVLIDFTDEKDTIDKQGEVLRAARATLHAHRNLCEDFLDPVAVERQPFQISRRDRARARPGRSRCPRSRRQSSSRSTTCWRARCAITASMRCGRFRKPDGGEYQVDDIFEGPALVTGFMKDEEVDDAGLPTVVRLSTSSAP